ncbi:polyketide synthase [Aspergillus luchuensis]|uniref:Polyketide synthase n=1 Tax=Aspergillus kawachii TaxID=1069201 RepID=A0A146FSJ3_ASPKA|nr:polyketide synthase [Aspergillus luchuensis]
MDSASEHKLVTWLLMGHLNDGLRTQEESQYISDGVEYNKEERHSIVVTSTSYPSDAVGWQRTTL